MKQLLSRFWPLLLSLVSVTLAIAANNCGGGNSSSAGYSARTSKGVTIRSSSPIPTDVPPIIDAQLDYLFRIATAKGYTGFEGYTSYVVSIEPHDARCGPIGLLVTETVTPGTNYDGSEYDLDPLPGRMSLCAAGRFTPGDGVIHVTLDGIRTTAVVRYEGEHKLLYQADRDLYNATKIHGVGQGHPILGD